MCAWQKQSTNGATMNISTVKEVIADLHRQQQMLSDMVSLLEGLYNLNGSRKLVGQFEQLKDNIVDIDSNIGIELGELGVHEAIKSVLPLAGKTFGMPRIDHLLREGGKRVSRRHITSTLGYMCKKHEIIRVRRGIYRVRVGR